MTDLDYLNAYVAIGQVKARYCRFLDTQDWPAFAALFTEDFTLDVGAGREPVRGREAAMAMIQASLTGATTAHQIHSPEIELKGDEAQVIWAMQDRVSWDPPRHGIAAFTGYGHYHETYRREGGAWKIAASRLTRLRIDPDRAP